MAMEFINFIIEIFEGEYKDGKENGHGILKYKNVDIFEDEWENGKRKDRHEYLYLIMEIYKKENLKMK